MKSKVVRILGVVFFFALFCMTFPTSATATDYYVDVVSGSNATGDGSQANPWKNITYALTQVTGTGHVVNVLAGTYNQANGESFPINMLNGVSLAGADRNTTILDGAGGGDSVVTCNNLADTSTTISGFTIKNGTAADGGGGIQALNSNVTITNNVIINNSSDESNYGYGGGGGVFVYFDDPNVPANASVNISNNTVNNNSGGGGIHVACEAWEKLIPVTIENNLVDNNSDSGYGGGISVICLDSNLTIRANTVTNNASGYWGGGVYFDIIEGGFAELFVRIEDNDISYNRSDDDSGGIGNCCFPMSTHITGNTITYNTSDGYGGGIGFCCAYTRTTEISDIRLTDNVISHNEAEYCGGICVAAWYPYYIEGNEITDNKAGDLGGGICLHDAVGYIRDNLIARNTSDNRGGGIFVEGRFTDEYPLIISGNQIVDNEADVGGGIALDIRRSYGSTTKADVSDNTITGNSSDIGGGIYLYYAFTGIISNNTISENASGEGGGGIYSEVNHNGSLDVVNNVIVGNTLNGGNGGGIACVGSITYPAIGNITNNTIVDNDGGIYAENATITVTNSILWNNTDDLDGCSATYSDISDGDAGTGNISLNPQFVGSGDYHIQSGSPCIDSATSTGAPADDIDGDARPQGSGYDMGADEYV